MRMSMASFLITADKSILAVIKNIEDKYGHRK